MPECRRCGLALAPHEVHADRLCPACWDATEADCDDMAAQDEAEMSNLTAERLHRYGGEYHGG